EERRYRKALSIERKALKLAPSCPLVLWDYAGSLDMLGRRKEAIRIWRKLLQRGLNNIAYGECGEGLRWGRSLLNDCRYRIGWSYYKLGRLSLACRYIRQHIRGRSPKLYSIYDLRAVKKDLALVKERTKR